MKTSEFKALQIRLSLATIKKIDLEKKKQVRSRSNMVEMICRAYFDRPTSEKH